MRTTRLVPLAFAAVTAAAGAAGAQQATPTQASAPAAAKPHKKHETQAELMKEAKISMDSARALAMKTVPGATIQSGEIEREGGKLIYSFDMKVPAKSGIDEVNVDAMTGALIAHQHETPADERKEAKQESAKKPATPKP
jgi:uncharacterized membrane protein YkoI